MKKPYKASYRLFWNTQLKEVPFLDGMSHPLYFQLTYQRKNTMVKSVYFEVLSSSTLSYARKNEEKGTSRETVLGLEKTLINSIIDELGEDFSQEVFKRSYAYYGTDLIAELEEGFKAFLTVFFIKHNLPDLGRTIAVGSGPGKLYDVLADLRQCVNGDVLEQLERGAIEAKQPFVIVFEYFQTIMGPQLPYLNIFEWRKSENINKFARFLQRRKYDNATIQRIQTGIMYWESAIMKKTDDKNS